MPGWMLFSVQESGSLHDHTPQNSPAVHLQQHCLVSVNLRHHLLQEAFLDPCSTQAGIGALPSTFLGTDHTGQGASVYLSKHI